MNFDYDAIAWTLGEPCLRVRGGSHPHDHPEAGNRQAQRRDPGEPGVLRRPRER